MPETGVAALIREEPVAVFRTHDDQVFALSNVDPITGASVLSRGIVGTRQGQPIVASPLLKNTFDLRTGQCHDPDTVVVKPYDALVEGDLVYVRRRGAKNPAPPPSPTSSLGQKVINLAVGELELNHDGAHLNGTTLAISLTPLLVLQRLAEKPGTVYSRRALLEALPADSSSEHGVEMAIARLRLVLGAEAIQTVVKRGYRLQVGPSAPTASG
jgi:nitrite reductase (NADH) small subunit